MAAGSAPGNNGGVGSGTGGGLGSGEDGGAGGGVFDGGTHGYGMPACLYCPRAEFSDEAVKSKYQGVVVLTVIIGPDGRASDIHISKGLGPWPRRKGHRSGSRLALYAGEGT